MFLGGRGRSENIGSSQRINRSEHTQFLLSKMTQNSHKALTKDLHMNGMLSFAMAVCSHQLVVALVLPDSVGDGNLGPHGCAVHLKVPRQEAQSKKI